jgi:hypothetical protein
VAEIAVPALNRSYKEFSIVEEVSAIAAAAYRAAFLFAALPGVALRFTPGSHPKRRKRPELGAGIDLS